MRVTRRGASQGMGQWGELADSWPTTLPTAAGVAMSPVPLKLFAASHLRSMKDRPCRPGSNLAQFGWRCGGRPPGLPRRCRGRPGGLPPQRHPSLNQARPCQFPRSGGCNCPGSAASPRQSRSQILGDRMSAPLRSHRPEACHAETTPRRGGPEQRNGHRLAWGCRCDRCALGASAAVSRAMNRDRHDQTHPGRSYHGLLPLVGLDDLATRLSVGSSKDLSLPLRLLRACPFCLLRPSRFCCCLPPSFRLVTPTACSDRSSRSARPAILRRRSSPATSASDSRGPPRSRPSPDACAGRAPGGRGRTAPSAPARRGSCPGASGGSARPSRSGRCHAR